MSWTLQRHHHLFCTLFLFIVVGFLILVYPTRPVPICSIVLPAPGAQHFDPVPASSVKLYRYISADTPHLANINMEQYATSMHPEQLRAMMEKAKQLAAKIGATGLVVRFGGFSQGSGAEAVLSMDVLQMIAIRASDNDVPLLPAGRQSTPSDVLSLAGGAQ